MADRAITDLPEASAVTTSDLFVLQQSGAAKKVTGETLIHDLSAALEAHGGVVSVVKRSTSGLNDTYRMTFRDGTYFDYVVKNGAQGPQGPQGPKGDPGTSSAAIDDDVTDYEHTWTSGKINGLFEDVDADLTTHQSQIANEVTRATAAETHLDKIKADRAVLAFLDRRAEYIYKHIGQNQEYDIVNIPTASTGIDPDVEAYSRNLASGVQGVIPKTFGGKTVVVNQLCHIVNGVVRWLLNGHDAGFNGYLCSLSYANNKTIITPNSGTERCNWYVNNPLYYAGKKYIIVFDITANVDITIFDIDVPANILTKISAVYNGPTSDAFQITFRKQSGSFDGTETISIDGNTINCIDLTQMFGAEVANTITTPEEAYALGVPREYVAYNPGELRSADVEQIASNSNNIFDIEKYLTDRGIVWAKNGNSYTFNISSPLYSRPLELSNVDTPITVSGEFINPTASNPRIQILKSDGTVAGTFYGSPTSSATYTGTKIRIDYSNSNSVTMKNFKLEFGNRMTPYKPYGAFQVLRIPTQLRTFLKQHGYGLSAGSIYNNVDFLNKVSTELLKKENLGADGISFTESRDGGYYTSSLNKKGGSRNVIIGSYTLQRGNWSWANFDSYPDMAFGVSSSASLFFKNTAYTSSSGFKASLANEYVVFELATPNYYYDPTSPLLVANGGSITPDYTMTSSSSVIPSTAHHIVLWDELFPDTNEDLALIAESGGTVTFEQTEESGQVHLELPIPNTLDYLVNVPQAAGNL